MNKDILLELMKTGFPAPINIDIGINKEHKHNNKSTENKKIENKNDIYSELRSISKKVPLHWRNEEELTDRMVSIVEMLAKKHIGMSKSLGMERYDINKIANMLVTYNKHLIHKAKYQKVSKNVEIFIDTSLSLNEYRNSIVKCIKTLENNGYRCVLRGVGNGFNSEDCYNDQYNVRETLEGIGAGVVPYICRPSEETAIKICNESEFSIIISDFDGLSSIVRVANGCFKNKVPYFLSTENRYSWKNPSAHEWVDKEYSTYTLDRVFDIGKKRN